MPAWQGAAARAALVGDDVLRVAANLGSGPVTGPAAPLWTGFALAAVAGVLWAFATYAAGSALASLLGQRPLRAVSLRRRPGGAGGAAGAAALLSLTP